MNYIRHLTAFMQKAGEDNRLFPNHISLYLALFYFWNLNRFENPFPVNRGEIMKLSKIGSLNTYHKCLHDLHNYCYLEYKPSHNPIKGSFINLYKFDTTLIQPSSQNQYNSRLKIDTTLAPLYKHNKHINNNRESTALSNLKNNDLLKADFNTNESSNSDFIKNIPPAPADVNSFFIAAGASTIESQKFFNHFQSNGWKVGGITPMKDWQAAAQKWILNISNFSNPYVNNKSGDKKTQSYVKLKNNDNKDYNIPL